MRDWFSGATIIVRYDEQRQAVVILARNGKVPPLELPAAVFVTATARGAQLELVGAFGDDRKIVLKLASADDAIAIAHLVRTQLGLPRSPQSITIDDITATPEGAYVVLEGRCFPYANGPVMDERVALRGVPSAIDHNAPYRAAGFLRHGADRPELQVFAIEHLNPPVTWLTGETVRVVHAPERALIGFLPQPAHAFTEPGGGTHELWLPTDTIAFVTVDDQRLVFEGDLTRTSHGMRVALGPVSANDARAIFTLLDERFQIPRTPQRLTAVAAAALTTITYVEIEGTFYRGHRDSANFDANIKLGDSDRLVHDARYRVTGFLAPAFRPDGPFLGYTGPRMNPLVVERLG